MLRSGEKQAAQAMAKKDQIDQDALAAEWGLALNPIPAPPAGADAARGPRR